MPRFNRGFVKVYHDEFDSVLSSNPYLWFIWSWLKVSATRFETTMIVNYEPMTLPVGSVVFGLHEIAERGNMGLATVHRWIGFLEKAGYISVIRGKRGTIVTIRDFEQFCTDTRKGGKIVENDWKDNEKLLENDWKLNRDKKEEEEEKREERINGESAIAPSPNKLDQTQTQTDGSSSHSDLASLASQSVAGAKDLPPLVALAPPSKRSGKTPSFRQAYPDWFESLWEAYGKIGNKAKAYSTLVTQKLTQDEMAQLNRAVQVYSKAHAQDRSFQQHFTTFLNSDWRTHLEKPERKSHIVLLPDLPLGSGAGGGL